MNDFPELVYSFSRAENTFSFSFPLHDHLQLHALRFLLKFRSSHTIGTLLFINLKFQVYPTHWFLKQTIIRAPIRYRGHYGQPAAGSCFNSDKITVGTGPNRASSCREVNFCSTTRAHLQERMQSVTSVDGMSSWMCVQGSPPDRQRDTDTQQTSRGLGNWLWSWCLGWAPSKRPLNGETVNSVHTPLCKLPVKSESHLHLKTLKMAKSHEKILNHTVHRATLQRIDSFPPFTPQTPHSDLKPSKRTQASNALAQLHLTTCSVTNTTHTAIGENPHPAHVLIFFKNITVLVLLDGKYL